MLTVPVRCLQRNKALRLPSLIRTCFNNSPRIAQLGLDATSGENCLHLHLSASHLAAAFQLWPGRAVSLEARRSATQAKQAQALRKWNPSARCDRCGIMAMFQKTALYDSRKSIMTGADRNQFVLNPT